MSPRTFVALGIAIAALFLLAEPGPVRAASGAGGAADTLSPEWRTTMVEEYCLVCHNDTAEAGGMSLEAFDAGHPEHNPELAEKMIRKLRAGMMPPSYAPRPEPEEIAALAASLEARIDEVAARRPYVGRRSFLRLSRAEYARTIRDLLGLEVDVAAFLPPDTISHSFDNIVDVQTLSPALMDGYLRAAGEIARLAIGDPQASPREATYKVPRTASQMHHVEGAPLGTRGGIAVVHTFPADGEYVFKVQLHGTPTGFLFGRTVADEQLEISIDGERKAVIAIDRLLTESDPNGLTMQSEPVYVKAGPHRVAAAFVERWVGPVDDLLRPIEHTLADTTIGRDYGVTALPHLRDLVVSGPYRVTGVSETPVRRRIFTCRPTAPEEELPCAREIVTRLATKAYRRPVDEIDLEGLMTFYEQGAEEGGFEIGIRTALQAILASPHFVFRVERVAADGAPGDGLVPIRDVDLASRLSYFLWATGPDDELLELAARGALSEPGVLEAQARRMLADPRSEALASRFARYWLRLQDLEKIHPDALLYPQYDHHLAEAMERETELLFEHLVREDRSLLELLTADYTFVNERLARHYGIPNVTGEHFRKVAYPDDRRRGILGHGSILMLTSIADRTSPVQRGKWVLEVLLGTPPPPPPPNVPALEETAAAEGTRLLTVRERMELHRSNPACQSCHDVIDPLGLALENFDVTGAWRVKDNGVPVDATGELYDGTPLEGPAGLRAALLRYKEAFVRTFTESLLTYALGRRVEYYDMPTVRAIAREAAANDYRMSSFILGVVRAPAFRFVAEGGAESTEGR